MRLRTTLSTEAYRKRGFVSITTPVPTARDVGRIAAIQDPVLRNLEITACYAELAAATRARLGSAADWCTFATWASRQAGSTIRGEDLHERFARRLGRHARLLEPGQSLYRVLLRKGLFDTQSRLGRAVAAIHTPFDAFERASAAVAAGNLKVFEEIGREFARFLEQVPGDEAPASASFTAFASQLRAGEPPEGQQLLREAFAHYQQHRLESDPAARAAWTLLANLKIGLHEQTRLQPEIARAVDAPLTTVRDLGARVLHALIPASRHLPHLLRTPAYSAIGWLAMRVHHAATAITREVVTEAMMVLALPTGVLALGRNLEASVPAVFGGSPHAELAAFIKEHDPCPPGTSECGADDWCNLPQRMHYILHLFRAYAEEPRLWAPPFTPEQVVSFRAGVIPVGEL
jgi:hypothetical protein